MRINSFEIVSESSLVDEIRLDTPVSIALGHGACRLLDRLRELIGDWDAEPADETVAVLADVVLDGRLYDVCHIRDSAGETRLAVNFTPDGRDFSMTDTEEYEKKRRLLDTDRTNLFFASRRGEADSCLSESDRIIAEFNEFVRIARDSAEKGDLRPIFIYGILERIDEAKEAWELISELLPLGRQIFVAVETDYPIEKLVSDRATVLLLDEEAES